MNPTTVRNKKNKRLTAGLLTLLLLLSAGCGNAAQPAPAEPAGSTEEADSAEAGNAAAEAETEAADGQNSAGQSDAGQNDAGQTGEASNADAGTGGAAGQAQDPGQAQEPQGTQEPQEPVDPMTLYEPHEETVTLMLYMTGSDLESGAAAATSDMAEIAQSGIDLGKVNLLIFTGGAPAWHSEDPVIPTDANVLYRLTESGYEEVERLEALSMGDPANLERFLSYCFENYKADSYDLILWDHGNGPVIGYGSDKQFGGDSMTLPEMRDALEASPFGEENKLSLIGFDACLMSSVELMCVCAPYAQYMVASQETEPSFGWNYDFLALAGKIRTEDLAREIVREYNAFCTDYFAEQAFFQSDVTLAAVDLSHADELEAALDTLFAKAGDDVSGRYNDLAKARVKTHGFGRASTGSEYDLVDLESLMDQLPEKYSKEAEAVRTLVDQSVLVSVANVGESCGLSLFYPYYNKNYYKKAWKEEYAALGTIPSYNAFLSRYEQVWLGTDLKDLFNDALVLQEGQDDQTFTMQLTDAQAENFASARYYILRQEGDGVYALVFSSSDVTEKKGLLTANFNGKVLYFSDNYDDKGIPPTRMYDTVDGVMNYTITANVQNGSILDDDMESQIVDVQIAVDQETEEVTVKGIYPSQTGDEIASGKREPIDLNAWNQIQFYNITGRYLTRDEEDRILPYWSWPEGDWIVWHEIPVANGLHFTYEPIYEDGQDYFIMFEVADVQDNRYSSELLPITLAEAPPEETLADARELQWESGEDFVFLEEQGTKAGLRLLKRASNGSILLQAYTEAGEEYPVHIDLDDVLINDNISLGAQSLYLWAEAGETYVSDLTSVMEACRLAGITHPESISFTLTLKRSDTDGYLIYKQPYVIRIGEGVDPQIRRVPVLGARAESQVLTETDGVRVELLDLGGTVQDSYDDPGMTAAYKVTNNSQEEQRVRLYGMTFNGVYLDKPYDMTLEPGEAWYLQQEFSQEKIRTLSNSYLSGEREDRLQSVSSAAVLMQVGGSVLTCPVTLSEAGDQEEIPAQGDVVYEDERFRLLVDSFRKETPEDGNPPQYIWEVWVENKTGEYWSYTIYKQGSDLYDYLASSNVGPGSRVLEQLYLSQEEDPGELQMELQAICYGTASSEAGGTFVLKAE